MKNQKVEFYLFGQEAAHVGVRIRQEKQADEGGWSCPFMGMVAYKCTEEQLIAICDSKDITWLDVNDTYDPFVTTAGVLREIGIDLGKWSFGFFGDVTPDDDRKMLILPTDSNHLIWLHHHVE